MAATPSSERGGGGGGDAPTSDDAPRYVALVLTNDLGPPMRVAVRATSFADARQKLEVAHGAGSVFDLRRGDVPRRSERPGEA